MSASGGVAWERGEMDEGVPEKTAAEGALVSSTGEGSHSSPSPSGSGEDFLFKPRRCFLSEEEEGEGSGGKTRPAAVM